MYVRFQPRNNMTRILLLDLDLALIRRFIKHGLRVRFGLGRCAYRLSQSLTLNDSLLSQLSANEWVRQGKADFQR